MALPLLLDVALTHLAGRKRQTAVSVLGAALGVGFFIAMAALMRGFQGYFVDTVINVQPHIVIHDEFRTPPRQPVAIAFPEGAVHLRHLHPRDEVRGVRNGRHLVEVLSALPGVAAAPTLTGPIVLRYGGADESATLTGIEPERERRVTRIERDMVEGSLPALSTTANGIIIGVGLADKLGARLGDTITAVSAAGVVLPVKIVGLFQTGIVALDDGQAYVLLNRAQILQDRPNVINAIRLRLANVDQAQALAAQLEARYGYRSESWQETNQGIFAVFIIQNLIMYSVVGAIMVVAGFGIFNIISTVVYEKARDIAILKSLGFAERDIRRIFLIQGVLVGAAGGLLGWGVGFALVQGLASIRLPLGGAIRADRLFLDYSMTFYWIGGVFAIVSASVAAYLPARKAARLNPVDIIRGAA